MKKTATITKTERWDIIAGGVLRIEWKIALTGGGFDGRTVTKRTRREARCDDFGYDWR